MAGCGWGASAGQRAFGSERGRWVPLEPLAAPAGVEGVDAGSSAFRQKGNRPRPVLECGVFSPAFGFLLFILLVCREQANRGLPLSIAAVHPGLRPAALRAGCRAGSAAAYSGAGRARWPLQPAAPCEGSSAMWSGAGSSNRLSASRGSEHGSQSDSGWPVQQTKWQVFAARVFVRGPSRSRAWPPLGVLRHSTLRHERTVAGAAG